MDVTLISRFGSDCPHSDMRSCKLLRHKTTIEPCFARRKNLL
jgi:hypothetical protein